MDGHTWLDHLIEAKNPWLSDCEPAPGFNRAVVRIYARQVLNGTWTSAEAHEALDALMG